MFNAFHINPSCQSLILSSDQQAIDTLLRLAEQYSGHTKNLANQSQGTVKGAHKDDSLQMAEADLKVCSRVQDE